MMTVEKAIEIAARRVAVAAITRRQWVVHTYRPDVGDTLASLGMPHDAALTYAWRAKVMIALHLLGIERTEEDLARTWPAPIGVDWRDAVRQIASSEIKRGRDTSGD